jgi:hypothetical protein
MGVLEQVCITLHKCHGNAQHLALASHCRIIVLRKLTARAVRHIYCKPTNLGCPASLSEKVTGVLPTWNCRQ